MNTFEHLISSLQKSIRQCFNNGKYSPTSTLRSTFIFALQYIFDMLLHHSHSTMLKSSAWNALSYFSKFTMPSNSVRVISGSYMSNIAFFFSCSSIATPTLLIRHLPFISLSIPFTTYSIQSRRFLTSLKFFYPLKTLT